MSGCCDPSRTVSTTRALPKDDEVAARANVLRLFAGLPHGPEDLEPATAPLLVNIAVPVGRAADASTNDGLVCPDQALVKAKSPKTDGGIFDSPTAASVEATTTMACGATTNSGGVCGHLVRVGTSRCPAGHSPRT